MLIADKRVLLARKVVSSNINQIAYRRKNLYVEFHSGAVYKYLNVPRKLYKQMRKEKSKGSYLHGAIKNQFEYVRVC